MILQRARTWLQHSILSVSFMVLAAGYMVALWAWHSAEKNLNESVQLRTEQIGDNLESALEKELVSYQEILRGGSALFSLKQNQVTDSEWQTFASTYNLRGHYPAVSALGFIEHVEAAELESHLAKMRALRPAYSVTPEYPRAHYYPTVLIAPSDEYSVYGFDSATEASRQKTMEDARDTGEAKISSIVELRRSRAAGIVMYYPVYSDGARDTQHSQRNHLGFISAAIQADALFTGLLQESVPANAQFGVIEGSGLSQNYIFKTSNFDSAQRPLHRQTIYLFGKEWTIETALSNEIVSPQERNQPNIILATGLLLATLFGLFVIYATYSRSRDINYRKQLELQDAKDELLSLASHQLRTPATGVKQYVGMLLEGYAGNIPKKQKDILLKAYLSNERQLDIVNQILHIARIESGRLPLDHEELSLNDLTKEVVGEQRATLKERKQKLKTYYPKRPVVITADPHYLRMVIENLLTNASKYTHDGGQISLKVARRNGDAVIEISDSGVGIDVHDIDKLFQKFSRIHNELSVSSGGTGIGLYLSKLIVELHGGAIDVSSRPGVGSTFKVTLPTDKTV